MPDYQVEKGLYGFRFWNIVFSTGVVTKDASFQIYSVLMRCFSADKAKRFLAEFYVDGDEGKIFKYGEQLVSCKFVSGFSFNSSNYVAFFSFACKNFFSILLERHQHEGFACVVDLQLILKTVYE